MISSLLTALNSANLICGETRCVQETFDICKLHFLMKGTDKTLKKNQFIECQKELKVVPYSSAAS
jgi:hypothetical protein